jgi:predicted Zn finger-like uncharacterized protein
MRIVCPACDATYDVPDAMLGAGTRAVRCAKCGHEWMPAENSVAPLPPDDVDFDADEPASARPTSAALEADPQGRHEPRLNPLRPRGEPRAAAPVPPPPDPPPPRGGARAIVAWALSILLLAAAGAAAVAWRTQVVATWPPSQRVFAVLGLK